MKKMTRFSKRLLISLTVMGSIFTSCGTQGAEPQVEGHYSYEHAFNYDLYGNHLDVHETGTMDFYSDSTALDSACQVYTVTFADGDTATLVFNYVSPSRWHLDGDTLHFAGIKGGFRMELMETAAADDADGSRRERALEMSQRIVGVVGGSIDYEYRFHIDTLTADKMQWSFTYRDGHSDTWEFFRK